MTETTHLCLLPLSLVQHRIVFDEGHNVKSGSAQQSKACVVLRSPRRWCCTGTPIATAIEELLGQVGKWE